jgi:hypothetical protein
VRDDPKQSYLCAGDAAFRASELEKQAPSVGQWCRRENVGILTAHDDAAARVLGEGYLLGPSPG